MPGKCLMGCFKNDQLLNIMKSYTSLNYGFSFLTQNPDPDQDGCTEAGDPSPPAKSCPEWDGQNIYLAKSSKQDAVAVTSSTTIDKPISSIVAITEAVRIGRMHPDGPKRVKIVLGGWSDFARMASADNGVKAAKLMGKFVAHTFADGVDIDMEHLTPYNKMGKEIDGFVAFVKQLRQELDTVTTNWASNAQAKKAGLDSWYNAMEDWQKGNVKDYYHTTANYLQEVAANPCPHLEISWTTRFNAFLPEDNHWNYLEPDSLVPNSTYATDNEGKLLWPDVKDHVDTINVMAYDAGGIKINMETVLKNFVAYSGDASIAGKVNIGFEPGEQAAGGVWEGMDADKKFAQFAKDNGYGGAMIWAANPNPAQQPEGSQRCPEVAAALADQLQPEYAWGPAATWTKCNSAGWWPSADAAEAITV
jgi:GH18 family chitinase